MDNSNNYNGMNNEQTDNNTNQNQQQSQINNQGYNQQQTGQYQYNQPNYQSQNFNQQQSQQYQYGGPMYQQPYHNQQDPNNVSGMAIASLVCGIVGILINCCTAWYISLPLAIVGLVMGILTVKNNRGGRTMAIVGIILSSIAALIGIVVLIGCIVVSSNRSLFDQLYNELNRDFRFDLDRYY